ncbi:MAG TPA: cell division topological specificity factor MinE [Candidatus Cybelea sp.]|nr:cell division topological specificity factor MinE [Candidatus Cybelea sp.]
MIEFLRRLFGQSGSSATAKERLRLVLMTDHLELAPEMIEKLKADLVDVISRHVEVDRDRIEVNFERQDSVLALLANIPIVSVNRPGGNGSHSGESNGSHSAESNGSAQALAPSPTESPAQAAAEAPAAEDAVAVGPAASKKKTAGDAAPHVRKRRRRKKNAGPNAAAAATPT